jgi:hypothetical protein
MMFDPTLQANPWITGAFGPAQTVGQLWPQPVVPHGFAAAPSCLHFSRTAKPSGLVAFVLARGDCAPACAANVVWQSDWFPGRHVYQCGVVPYSR